MTLLIVTSAFLLGVFLGPELHLPNSALLLLTSTTLLSVLLLRRVARSALPAILALFVVRGSLRITTTDDAILTLAPYHTLHAVRVEGVVLADVELVGTAMRFRVRVERI